MDTISGLPTSTNLLDFKMLINVGGNFQVRNKRVELVVVGLKMIYFELWKHHS